VTAASRRLLTLFAALLVFAPALVRADAVQVSWQPAQPRAGDAVTMRVHGAPAAAVVEAFLDGHPLGVYRTGGGHAAVWGIDMDAKPGARPWRVVVRGARAATLEGRLTIVERTYTVQHLTVAPGFAQLDPETERRANDETARMREVYRTISGERLWEGSFVRPVPGDAPGTGFGSRRVINGEPRSPHSGTDFPAPVGAPVIASNRGRVALVGEFFFPGRLVILDHGLGIHTAYFHLDTITVSEGQVVERGAALGTVGMTGRVTGPHLHFGAQTGTARIDPTTLFALD